jgi:hypothetical protein
VAVPDFYYIDLLYDPKDTDFGSVVGGATGALVEAGCAFDRVSMLAPTDEGDRAFFARAPEMDARNLGEVAGSYWEAMRARGQNIITFPPMGRVMLRYPFKFDEDILDDIHEEEEESGSSRDAVGLSFSFSDSATLGKKIDASVSFWEEYVLTLGRPETHRANMADILGMVERVALATRPYFGAMNNEIHLGTDRSLDLLRDGRLPEGNDYVLVGAREVPRLDIDALKRSRRPVRRLGEEGGLIIEFTRRWDGPAGR